MREAAHLVRLAVILVAGVAVFALVRQATVPAGFGQFGHYRPGALAEAASKPIRYAGREVCTTCHDEALQVLAKSKHKSIGCEACHGPQSAHAEDPDARKPVLPDTSVLCAKCHETVMARPKWMPQVVSKEHSGGEPCKRCHKPHSPKM